MTVLDEKTTEEACERFGVDTKKLRERLSIRISVMRDVSIKATITTNSAEMDFAVLKLDDKLSGGKNLPLRASSDLEQTEDTFALGFPTVPTFSQDGAKLTSEDVTITYGKVNRLSTIRGVEYVVHSAIVSGGNSGGPLVDAEGNVVGIVQGKLTPDMLDSYGYAIASDALIETLDRLGVTYTKAREVSGQTEDTTDEKTTEETTSEPVTEDKKVDKSALDSAITQASGTDTSAYTEESVKAMNDALEAAKAIQADDSASQTAVDDAATKLTTAVTNLEPAKSSSFPIWLIAVIAAAVVAIIVVIILMTRNSKKPAPRAARPVQPQTPPVAPIPPVQQPMNSIPPAYQGGAGTSVLGGGSNETTVLSSGSNETTVLSADYGTLTRISTGEKITINKERFVIGRERGRVDYCISDNTAVGRSHAIIVNRGGNAYVIDQNSRNCTYVNDQRAGANQEVKIKSGDKITFADEAFTYNAR